MSFPRCRLLGDGELTFLRNLQAPIIKGRLDALRHAMAQAAMTTSTSSNSAQLSTVLPFADQTNSPPLSPPTRPLSPPPKAPRRKLPPPVTASVIKQAGPEAVAASANQSPGMPSLKSPLSSPLSSIPSAAPRPLLGDISDQADEGQPFHSTSAEVDKTRAQAEERKGVETGADVAQCDEEGRLLKREEGEDYMTDTAKGRLDEGLRALEEALR